MIVPGWLGPAGIAAILLVLVVGTMAASWYRQHLAILVGWPATSPSRARRRARLRAGLHVAAAACLGAALFEAERHGQSVSTADAERSRPILFLLDVSRSMDVADVKPTRHDVAVEVIRRVTAAAPRQAGLMLFAGEVLLVCPVTTDRRALQLALDDAPDALVGLVGGSAIDLAVAEGLRTLLRSEPRGAIVLLSDGEDTTGSLAEVAELAVASRIPIHVVGIGTVAGGVMAVRRGEASDGARPEQRLSRLNVTALQGVAAVTSGRYVSGGVDEATGQLTEAIEAGEHVSRSAARSDLARQLMWAALAALTIELMLRGLR